jgi:hypothetical protein
MGSNGLDHALSEVAGIRRALQNIGLKELFSVNNY